MLRNSFYTLTHTEKTGATSFKSTVIINKQHAIFKGHFPEFPVVPGVCMMQMVKELLEDEIQKRLQLKTAGNIKFLSVINPAENSQIEIALSYLPAENDTYNAEAAISISNSSCFKIVNAIYK